MLSPKIHLKKIQILALTTAALISTVYLTSSQVARQPAYAHEVAIEGDVGATLHIEPNDTPKAGEEVLAWFALTRPGGETIPLDSCNCTLAVYAQPSDQPYEGKTPTLTPELSAVDAEGYQDIPGTRLTFPDVGTYTMVISGEPKQAGNFTPFSLDFEKTIASGAPVPETGKEAKEALTQRESVEASPNNVRIVDLDTDSNPINITKWAIVGLAGLAAVGFIWTVSRLSRRSK